MKLDSRRALLLTLMAGACSLSSVDVVEARGQRDAIDGKVIALQSSAQIDGIGIVVFDNDGLLYEKYSGNISQNSAVPVASATKWLTSSVIMSLVDDGTLSLDGHISDYLPNAPESYRDITIRQLMSHTSGIEPQTVLKLRGASTSKEVADAILATSLMGKPGEIFAYGGSSMQLAAYIAEVRTGKAWDQLFSERVAKPLGLRTASWVHPMAAAGGGSLGGQGVGRQAAAGGSHGALPYVAGGLSISPGDLATFMRMILGYGELNGVRVLSKASVVEMERLQTGSVSDFRRLPVAKPDWKYGLGLWCERIEADGACTLTNSAGAFGTVPWIDRRLGRAGVFVTKTQLPKVLDGMIDLRTMTNGLAR